MSATGLPPPKQGTDGPGHLAFLPCDAKLKRVVGERKPA
jgi:hypothetical protein